MAVTRKKGGWRNSIREGFTNDGMILFKLQMIEVDELDTLRLERQPEETESSEVLSTTNTTDRSHIGSGSTASTDSRWKPRRIDANDVIFYYTKRRPSQIREMSDMSQTATRIRDTNEFYDCSIRQGTNRSLPVCFHKKQLPTVGIGRNARRKTSKHEYDGKTLTPGMIKELNAGDGEVQVVNPTGRGSDATSFT